MRGIILWLRQNLGFTQTEVNGYLILQPLLIIVLFMPLITSYLFFSSPQSNFSPSESARLDSLVAIIERNAEQYKKYPKKKYPSYKKKYSTEKPQKKAVKLFIFNPNEIDQKQWESLGLKSYLAKRILKYRSKGGSFRLKKDLAKIYGFPKETYNQLYPYIDLPENNDAAPKKSETKEVLGNSVVRIAHSSLKYEKKIIKEFDLNLADTTTLKQLRGIGSKISLRIVKFRDKLGGFHSLAQVKEVYGLKDDVYGRLVEYSFLSNQPLKKLAINTADIKELISHPYINYNQAKVMVNYREQHGKFENIDSLKKVRILDQAFLDKIKPYISFE